MNNKGEGLGAILVTPEGKTIPMAKKLDFKITNNMVEYEDRGSFGSWSKRSTHLWRFLISH